MYSTWLCLRDCITWPPCCLLIERHFQPVRGNAMLLLPKLITQCAPKIETIAVQRQCCLLAVLQPGLLVFQLKDLWHSPRAIPKQRREKSQTKAGRVMLKDLSSIMWEQLHLIWSLKTIGWDLGHHLKPHTELLGNVCLQKGRLS